MILKQELLAEVRAFHPFDAEEVKDHARLLDFLGSANDPVSRANEVGHVTASAWILNPAHSHVLLIHHAKLGRWLQPGGHIEDEDGSLLAAAWREAMEETGLGDLVPLGEGIFDIEIHAIPALDKMPGHWHYDCCFAMVTRENGGRPAAADPKTGAEKSQWHSVRQLMQSPPWKRVTRLIAKTLTD